MNRYKVKICVDWNEDLYRIWHINATNGVEAGQKAIARAKQNGFTQIIITSIKFKKTLDK